MEHHGTSGTSEFFPKSIDGFRLTNWIDGDYLIHLSFRCRFSMIQRPPGRDGPLCQGLRLRSGPGRPRPLLGSGPRSDVIGCRMSSVRTGGIHRKPNGERGGAL